MHHATLRLLKPRGRLRRDGAHVYDWKNESTRMEASWYRKIQKERANPDFEYSVRRASN